MKKKFIFGFLLAGSLMCCNSVAFASTVDLSVYKFSYDNNDFLKEATPNFNLWNGDEVSLTLYKLDSSLVGTTPLNHVAKDIDSGEKEKYKAVLVKGNEALKNGKANFHVEDKGVYALVETKHPSDTKYWSRTMVFELKGNESPTQSIYLKNQGNTTGTTPLPSLNPVTPNNGSSTNGEGNNNTDNQTDNTNGNTDNSDGHGNKTLPDGTKVSPDGTKTLPDGTKVNPDGSIVLPNGDTIKPDGTVVDKNGNTINPAQGEKQPDGSTKLPDGTIIKPNGDKVLPNGTTIKPNGDVITPNGEKILHGGTVVKPNGDVILPDGTTIHHDGTITDKNGNVITPTIDENNNRVLSNGVIIKPNGDIILADGTVIHHDGSIANTNAQSGNNLSNATSKDLPSRIAEKLKHIKFPQTGDTVVGFILGVLMSSGLLWAWLLRKRRKENSGQPQN